MFIGGNNRVAFSIRRNTVDSGAVIDDCTMGTALHRAQQVVGQVWYVDSLVHNQMVSLPRVGMYKGKSTTDRAKLTQSLGGIISLHIDRGFVV